MENTLSTGFRHGLTWPASAPGISRLLVEIINRAFVIGVFGSAGLHFGVIVIEEIGIRLPERGVILTEAGGRAPDHESEEVPRRLREN
jgi:hypothetical protein